MDLFAAINPLLVVSGFVVGMLVGLTGVDGGSLMTPLLVLLFRVHATTAVGTDLLYAAITKTGGAHIWADRFDGALDDIFDLQDQIASSVVGAIEPKLWQSEIERATRKPTESLDARDLYLRALAQFHKYTEESMREVIALLTRALAIDASYAPAAAMIALCRVFQRIQGWGPIAGAEVAEGSRSARQAIEAGKDDPDALWMAGFSLPSLAGDKATGESAVDRAFGSSRNKSLSSRIWVWREGALCHCWRRWPGEKKMALTGKLVLLASILVVFGGPRTAVGDWSVAKDAVRVNFHSKALDGKTVFYGGCNKGDKGMSWSFENYTGKSLERVDDLVRQIVLVIASRGGTRQFTMAAHHYAPDNAWVWNDLLPVEFVGV